KRAPSRQPAWPRSVVFAGRGRHTSFSRDWSADVRFACSLARSRAVGGQGPLRIRAELASHGMDEAVIAAAFAALAEAGEDDWQGRARELARRRFGPELELLPVRRKAADFLLRRGFDGDCVRAAIRFDPDEV